MRLEPSKARQRLKGDHSSKCVALDYYFIDLFFLGKEREGVSCGGVGGGRGIGRGTGREFQADSA